MDFFAIKSIWERWTNRRWRRRTGDPSKQTNTPTEVATCSFKLPLSHLKFLLKPPACISEGCPTLPWMQTKQPENTNIFPLQPSVNVCVIFLMCCVLSPVDWHRVGRWGNTVSSSPFLVVSVSKFPITSSLWPLVLLLLSISPFAWACSCAGDAPREFVSCLRRCECVVLTAALSSLVPGYIVTAALAASLHGDSADSPTRPPYQSTSHRCLAVHLQALISLSKEATAVAIFQLNLSFLKHDWQADTLLFIFFFLVFVFLSHEQTPLVALVY